MAGGRVLNKELRVVEMLREIYSVRPEDSQKTVLHRRSWRMIYSSKLEWEYPLWSSGLRIQCGCSCGIDSSCSSDLILGPGTSIHHKYGQKKKKRKKKKTIRTHWLVEYQHHWEVQWWLILHRVKCYIY